MPQLKPYYPSFEKNEVLSSNFNPVDYITYPNTFSAAEAYLQRIYGKWAVNLFENVVAENYRKVSITDELLPKIAEKMQDRSSLVKTKLSNLKTEMVQLKNARIGNGDPLKGFLKSFDPAYR